MDQKRLLDRISGVHQSICSERNRLIADGCDPTRLASIVLDLEEICHDFGLPLVSLGLDSSKNVLGVQ